MIVFFNGEYIADDKVIISPHDRGFQYGDGIYEVARTYGGKLFRFSDHMERLRYSLSEISIEYNKINDIELIIYQLMEKNRHTGKEISAYIQITRGAYYPRRHSFPPKGTVPTVYIAVSDLPPRKENNEGIKVILEDDIRWGRCDIKSVSLLPNALANQNASEQNAGEAIWVKDGELIEGSHTNFFGVRDGTIHTAPLSRKILSGVTRKVILEVCGDLKIPVEEKGIKVEEINSYDEFFVSGTTTEIKPVVRIGSSQVRNGMAGKTTKILMNAFYEKTNKN